MEKTRADIFVAGRVQGVAFRHSARIKAKKLGITGWIKNLNDGRVEAILEGEKSAVEKMIQWMKRGPILANVDEVEVIFEDYKGEFQRFD
ncbi:MAG: acylphosphatase, acylphosphatase [Parcubacteria group bacterium GW2011_GWC1_38_6]|nr:MAG: acylphosphatase, acylphosphatase [Parcubacteria group bacterium GW2011_GWC1_38_6]